jgi:hypothetical protein
MKIVNGVRIHTIELTDRAIATIHQLANMAMAPHQALLDEIAPQLPQKPLAPPQPAQSAPTNAVAPPQAPPPPQPPEEMPA